MVEGTITNAGTMDNVVTSYKVMRGSTDVTSFYTFNEPVKGTLTVDKKAVTLASKDLSKAYDGAALTNGSEPLETETGWATGEGATYNFTGTQTDVGSSANAFSYTLNAGTLADNYTIGKTEGTLTVTASTGAALDITNYSGVYDSETHSITVNNPINGDTLYYSMTNNGTDWSTILSMFTDVTESTTVYVKVENANYEDRTGSGTVEITARTIGITADSNSKVYDGTALTDSGWSLSSGTVATGEAIESVNVTGSQITVGSSGNVASGAVIKDGETDVTANYSISYVKGTLTVTKAQGGGGGGGTIIPEEEVPLALTEDHIAYIQGYPENVVKPLGNVTREEVAAVFFRLLKSDYRETIRTAFSAFPDVEKARWSTKHIATLVTGKIIEGYPDGTFRPGNPITRAELAVIASRFDNLETTTSSAFSDISGHWAEEYIKSAYVKGWVNGYPDGTFRPDQYITRAEYVTLVNNVLQRRVHAENILPDARQFPDLEKGKWYYEAMEEAINSHLYTRLEDTFEEWTLIYFPSIEM